MSRVIIVRGGMVIAVDSFASLEAAATFWPEEERFDAEDWPGVSPGWTWDGTAFEMPPSLQEAPEPARTMSRIQFLKRIQPETRIAIRAAAKSDPVIEDALALLDATPEVDLDDPDTVRFVGYLTSVANLLTAEQAAAILA